MKAFDILAMKPESHTVIPPSNCNLLASRSPDMAQSSRKVEQ